MATWSDVRRIVLALPGTSEKVSSGGSAAWTVHGKSFAWERPLRKTDLAALGASAPTGAIFCIRTADLEMKDALLSSDADVFFTTPHFDGYPAVLIRLAKIRATALADVILEAWLSRAPRRIAAEHLRSREAASRQTVRRVRANPR